jgi:hypothetical protein
MTAAYLFAILLNLALLIHALWSYKNPEKWPINMFHAMHFPKWFMSDKGIKIQSLIGFVALTFTLILGVLALLGSL